MACGGHQHPVVFAGWDDAFPDTSEELMRAGKLPVLAGLLERGAIGRLAGYAPFSCPMQWTTMATGVLPPRHGIHGWRTVREGRVQMAGAADRGVPAFWNVMADHGISCGVVDWPASGSENHPQVVSTRSGVPLAGDLDEVRVTPADLDPGLLGLFIPRIAELEDGDRRVAVLMHLLARLYTTHNVAIRMLESVRCLAVRYDFIGEVAGRFAPGREGAGEIFGGVIEAAYRVQDLLLGDLLDAAGGEANATMMAFSDRGENGWAAMSGPRIIAGAKAVGGRMEDVAPTLLALVDVPALTEMKGRVLAEGLKDAPPERITGPDHVPSEEEAITADSEEARAVIRENDLNLGIALLASDQAAKALAPLERCYFSEPESPSFAFQVARCRARLGMFMEAKRALATLEDARTLAGSAALMRAEIALAERCGDVALAALEPATMFHGAQIVERQRLRWQALLLEKQYSAVADEISRAMPEREAEEMDLILLSHSRLCEGDFEEAAEVAEKAMGIDGRSPACYNLLGQSLERLGRFPEARRVYGAWLCLEPGQEFASQRVVALAKDPPRPLPKTFEPSLVRAKADEWMKVRETSRRESDERMAAICGSAHDLVVVRSAHEREMGRIARHFQIAEAPDGFGEAGKWVTVAGPERRIVAVYQMLRENGVPEDDGATVRYSILPRWLNHRAVTEALGRLEERVLESGWKRLRLQADPESEDGLLWRALGFREDPVREVWTFGTRSYLRGVVARMLAMPASGGEWCEPLGEGNLVAAADLCGKFDLLPRERVIGAGAFDPRVSFVVRDERQVLGVLLSRIMGKTAYIEVLAKRPDAGRPLARVVPMLLKQFADACAVLDIPTAHCVIRPDLTPALPRLMIRSEGRRLSRFARFERDSRSASRYL